MGILAHEHLEQALAAGLVGLDQHGSIGPLSIDVCLGDELIDSTTRRPIRIPPDGLIVGPQDSYLWEFPTELSLAAGLIGEVVTRSSYARLGMAVSSEPSKSVLELSLHEDRDFRPLCTLETFGTMARVRPGEPLGQLVLRTGYEQVPVEQLGALMAKGDLVVADDRGLLSEAQVSFNGGLELTMDRHIRVYRAGTVLDPLQGVGDDDFFLVDLTRHPEGYWLGQDSFFLSSSRQAVATSNKYVISVTPFTSPPADGHDPRKDRKTHPNAPYHAFGHAALRPLTFENHVLCPDGIRVTDRGKQAELHVHPLISPSAYSTPSRYQGQEGPTMMRQGR